MELKAPSQIQKYIFYRNETVMAKKDIPDEYKILFEEYKMAYDEIKHYGEDDIYELMKLGII